MVLVRRRQGYAPRRRRAPADAVRMAELVGGVAHDSEKPRRVDEHLASYRSLDGDQLAEIGAAWLRGWAAAAAKRRR